MDFTFAGVVALIGFAWAGRAILKIRDGVAQVAEAKEQGSSMDQDTGQKRVTAGVVELVVSAAAVTTLLGLWQWG